MSINKMKGLLKGLRYISNIFEADDKEPEMQIGFPTDVKHVAHIGWDGASVNSSPSWMNDFKPESSNPLTRTTTGERNRTLISPKSPSQDTHLHNGAHGSSSRDLPLTKPSKRNPSAATNPDSPPARRHSRRHQSSSINSPDRDKSDGSSRSRRERSATTGGSDISNYTLSLSSSPQQDQSVVPKQPRRRKVKGSSSGSSSSKPSRSNAVDGRAIEQQKDEDER